MRAATIPLALLSFLLTGQSLSLAQRAQPPGQPAQIAPAQPAPGQPASRRGGPCDQIDAACKRAGFVPKGAKTGAGIIVDCIRPIIAGTPQVAQGTNPLPQIDPQVVAACKQQNPNFGMGNRAKLQPSGQPTTKPLGT